MVSRPIGSNRHNLRRQLPIGPTARQLRFVLGRRGEKSCVWPGFYWHGRNFFGLGIVALEVHRS